MGKQKRVSFALVRTTAVDGLICLLALGIVSKASINIIETSDGLPILGKLRYIEESDGVSIHGKQTIHREKIGWTFDPWKIPM